MSEHNLPLTVWLPLLQETLRREGTFRWKVQGSSMVPTLKAGSVIEIVPPPTQLRLGELVVFALEDSLVVHRLVHYTTNGWITQGDGRSLPDRPIQQEQILGVATRAYENEQQYWPGRAEGVLARFWLFRYHGKRLFRGVKRQLSRLLYG